MPHSRAPHSKAQPLTKVVKAKSPPPTLRNSHTMVLLSGELSIKQRAVLAANGSTPFQRDVYTLICCIPPGKVTTYKAIATALSSHPRAVGQALKRNPLAPAVPCHRVVSSSRVMCGFSGHTKGSKIEKKISMLRCEGVQFDSLEDAKDETKAKVATESLIDSTQLQSFAKARVATKD
eukprot:TRINITY_DN7993_c0_g1_i1.p1 TRINITY_DN7993_c0_g1~~TRINITY_DN7993_c0_g1_i1.p1  ORF type:complete len:191 (-),score=31.66 TRINITY_DN7993_c0_g1_i1:102-635(-)